MQVDFEIGPLKLADHPHRTAERQQHPEDIATPVRSSGIQQESRIGEKRNETLHNIAKITEGGAFSEVIGHPRVED